jgi:hypothetical protein
VFFAIQQQLEQEDGMSDIKTPTKKTPTKGRDRYKYSWQCSRCARRKSNFTGVRPGMKGCPSAPASGALPGKHLWGSAKKTLVHG